MNEKEKTLTLADAIHDICLRFQGVERLYLAETIDPQRMRNARKAMHIPEQEAVILLYDDSLLENNKAGFAVCANGLYWKNDWTVASRRTRLSWEEFAQRRRIREKDLTVDLARSDRIGLAVLGKEERAQVIDMLVEIQAACKQSLHP